MTAPTMRTPSSRPALAHAQSGAFLLEALVGVLIFAFGILGLVGLQAQAIRNTNDLQYRGEAIQIANAAMGRMWTMDRTQLKTSYEGDEGTGGEGYTALVEAAARLPGNDIDTNKPTVTVEAGPTTTSSEVTVTVRWQLPGEAGPHQYVATVIVGQNT
jgi:type IV pilus assembly protein PilV